MLSVTVDDRMTNADECRIDAKTPLPDMTGRLALQYNTTYFNLSLG